MSELPIDLDELATALDDATTGDVLAGITVAERLAGDLAILGDRLVGYAVERARSQGRSWAEIGAHLGVSRQAAQQRFAGRTVLLTVSDLDRAGGLARMTGRAKTCLMRAEASARELTHDAVEPTHLMLALLDDREALSARALTAIGVDLAGLKGDVQGLLAPHNPGPPTSTIPLSGATRAVLTGALVSAVRLGHNYVGTEHLLLGILNEAPAPLGRVLATHGVEQERATHAVAELLEAYLRHRE